MSYTPKLDEVIIVEGFLNYPNGDFRVAPNPFNPSTTISFRVQWKNLVQLNIYNLRGQKVRSLIQEALPANEYDLVWDGTNDTGGTVASGTYFMRLRIGTELMQVRKLTILKMIWNV